MIVLFFYYLKVDSLVHVITLIRAVQMMLIKKMTNNLEKIEDWMIEWILNLYFL